MGSKQGQQATLILKITISVFGLCQGWQLAQAESRRESERAVGFLISSICGEGKGIGWGGHRKKGMLPHNPRSPLWEELVVSPQSSRAWLLSLLQPPKLRLRTHCLPQPGPGPWDAHQSYPMTGLYKYTMLQVPRCVYVLSFLCLLRFDNLQEIGYPSSPRLLTERQNQDLNQDLGPPVQR